MTRKELQEKYRLILESLQKDMSETFDVDEKEKIRLRALIFNLILNDLDEVQ